MNFWYRCPVCEAEDGKCDHALIDGAVTLLPCPFCGGPPVPHTFPKETSDGVNVKAYVFCHECGAEGPYVEGMTYDPEERDDLEAKAVLLWNARNARHLGMYDAGTPEGLNLYPRPDQPRGSHGS